MNAPSGPAVPMTIRHAADFRGLMGRVHLNVGEAASAEALVQSHAGEISLLPALPNGWREGSATGLRARGGFEAGIHWKGGKLGAAEIRNRNGGPCTVRYGERTASLLLKPGEAMRVNGNLVSAN